MHVNCFEVFSFKSHPLDNLWEMVADFISNKVSFLKSPTKTLHDSIRNILLEIKRNKKTYNLKKFYFCYVLKEETLIQCEVGFDSVNLIPYKTLCSTVVKLIYHVISTYLRTLEYC